MPSWIQAVSAGRKDRMAKTDKIFSIADKVAEWSLYIMIFALPFSKSIVEVTIVTALIAVVIKKTINGQALLGRSNIEILLYALMATSLVSIINTPHEQLHLSVRAFFSKSLKFAALFLIVKDAIDSRVKLNNFLTMALISCFIMIIDGLTQQYVTRFDFLHNYPAFKYFSEKPFDQTFPTASFPFPNDYAAWMLIFIFPLGLLFFLGKEKFKMRMACGVAFAGLLYMFILTKARGAWLGFLAALAVFSFIKMKKAGVLLLLAFALLTLFINKSVLSDIWSMNSVNDRTVMWQNGLKILKEHPVIGNGLNTFFANYAKVRNDIYKDKKGSYAHNCYLQMAADTGIVGLLSFIAFVTAVILKALRSLATIKDPSYHYLLLGVALGLIAFLLHSFVDTNLYSLNLAALFWLSAGLILAIIKIAETKA